MGTGVALALWTVGKPSALSQRVRRVASDPSRARDRAFSLLYQDPNGSLISEYLSGLERLAQRESLNLTQSRLVQFDLVKPHERLVSVSFTRYRASTSDLSNSSSWSALQGTEVPGRSRLEAGFPLRCFQRLSNPNLATRLCCWRNNRSTIGSSIPVLSY